MKTKECTTRCIVIYSIAVLLKDISMRINEEVELLLSWREEGGYD